jgi:NAD+ synthase
MIDRLRIALVQISQRVGDLTGNADAMLAWRAKAEGADLVVFPELQLIGYPPEDLVLKPALHRRAAEQLDRLVRASAEGGPAMIVGSVLVEDGRLYNVLHLINGGAIVATTRKHELPNYGTFDEKRWFTPGPLPEPIDWRGIRLGLPICEDMWFQPVCAHLKRLGAELLISPHGSPYEIGKDDLRTGQIASARVAETGLPCS